MPVPGKDLKKLSITLLTELWVKLFFSDESVAVLDFWSVVEYVKLSLLSISDWEQSLMSVFSSILLTSDFSSVGFILLDVDSDEESDRVSVCSLPKCKIFFSV